MNTQQLSNAVYKLGTEMGKRLLAAKERSEAGMSADSIESANHLRHIVETQSMMDGLYFTSRLLLDDDDWTQFLYRSGIPEAEAREAIERVETITNRP